MQSIEIGISSILTALRRYQIEMLKVVSLVFLALIVNAILVIDLKLALLLILAVLVLVQLIEPVLFIVLMIPVYFRMFGLFPRQYFEGLLGPLEPRDLLFSLLLILILVACWTRPKIFTRIRRSVLFSSLLFLMGYVVLRIVLTGIEVGEPVLAVRAGRRYFSYLVYFAVIAFVSRPQKGQWLINGLISLGLLIALMNLVAQFFSGWFARSFATATISDLYAYGGALGIKLHVPGRFIMFLALIWCFFRWLQFRRAGDAILLLVLGGGFIAQKYRTFYLILPFSVLLVWSLARKSKKAGRGQLRLMVGVALGIIMGLILLLLFSASLRADVARFAWEAWASATGKISTGTFQGRLQRASWRLELFRRHPVLGVGFIHDSLAPRLFEQESLAITFIGYADVLVTGGLLLVIAILWVVAVTWKSLLKGLRRHSWETDAFWIVAGAMSFSLMATLGMISWSLLTIDDGIIPLVIAIALAERFLAFGGQDLREEPISFSRVS